MCLFKKTVLLLLVSVVCFDYSNAQLLKKLKDKVNNAVNSASGNSGSNNSSGTNATTPSPGAPTNTKGGGLTNTPPPDVNAQIADAERSNASGDYSNARYSVQQALMSIELQIGKQVLQSLPNTVSGLQKDTTQSVVMSTQWGWNNMTIQTVYKKADQQMTVSIGNNGLYSSIANLYFNNAMYTQTSSNGNNPNVKQTRVKGNKAVITYDDSKGYTLLVSMGQTSLIAWECVNFSTEQDVMNAANAFDIDGIKKMLGEK